MFRQITQHILVAMTFALVAIGTSCTAQAQQGNANDCVNCQPPEHGNPDLFYNYYLPPGCGQVGAMLYLSPSPVPQHVGHTYITYQPLMPHEFMYPHHRTYFNYYDGGRGLNRTSVRYYNPPVISQVGSVLSRFRVAR
ncbi:MAG: hypothetical protein QGG36_28760 [Pirellulaceae bacterium]|jgi:hypothetical protein|nr:hypothetical protein [Pirellulaceae bacterium]MDP7019824.1 hypothetical protein [Pirellulaceae bacterium]